MATPQELQNALMLKKTQGLTTEQAVNQARVPVTSTSQINQDRLAQNQASRQGTPAPVLPTAPVAPTTPTTTPTTAPNGAILDANGTVTPTQITPEQKQAISQPLSTTDQATVDRMTAEGRFGNITGSEPNVLKQQNENIPKALPKVEAPIDYTQAKGREQEIQANLDSFKAKGMTPDEIMRASDYQNASPEKKALIEPYLKQQIPTASAMYNLIATKSDIPDDQKTSLPFKIAQNRYTKASSFSTMTPSQLANEMNNSRFIQGSQAYEDVKAMNPKLVQDTENLRIVNGNKQNIFTYTNNPDGTSTKVNNLEKTFAQDYIDNFGEEIKKLYAVQTPEQIRAIINTPDVIAAQDKATQIDLSMNEIEKQIEAVDKSVEEEMAGSGATGNRIALEKAIRKDKLEKEYNSQLKNYTTYANKANNLITQNTTNYTTSQAQKLAQATAMLPILQDQYKTAQAKAEAELALKDPATAIKTVMDEYKKLGIPFTSTVQSRLAEFKASGKPLEQFLTDMGKNIQESPAYKQYTAKKAGEGISYETIGDSVYRKNSDGSLTKTNISAKKTPEPVWQEWEDASGKHAGWVTPGVQPSTATASAVKPTGNIVPVTAGNKTVRLDQSGATGFESAINQLTTAGIPIVVGEGHRNQTDTIKSMADRYGIPFNASNPAETAQKLRSAGHQVADPGKSNHESGMAIDVYGSSKLDKVTPAQEKILNANGWYSAGIPGDAGHFEYRGGVITGDSPTIDNTSAYQKRLNTGALPTGMKEGTAQANEWLQGYTQWKQTNNPLSESVQKRVDSYSDDYSKNPNVQSAFKFAPLLRQYDTVKVSDLSSSQRQGIISDYAKALDPDSVVREGEYATVAKYSSSFGEKTLSEINQFLSGNGTLSDAAAQKVIDAIKSRGKNYVEQEKNVRNQYIEKINRATGYKDGDMQLVYPDYSTQSTNPQKSDFLNSLKSIATEFTKGLTSIK